VAFANAAVAATIGALIAPSRDQYRYRWMAATPASSNDFASIRDLISVLSAQPRVATKPLRFASKPTATWAGKARAGALATRSESPPATAEDHGGRWPPCFSPHLQFVATVADAPPSCAGAWWPSVSPRTAPAFHRLAFKCAVQIRRRCSHAQPASTNANGLRPAGFVVETVPLHLAAAEVARLDRLLRSIAGLQGS